MVGEDLQECVLAAGKTVATLWDAHRRYVDVRLMPQLCTRPAPATLRNPKLHCFAELILFDSPCGDYTLLSMWQTGTVVWVMLHFVFLWGRRRRGKFAACVFHLGCECLQRQHRTNFNHLPVGCQ